MTTAAVTALRDALVRALQDDEVGLFDGDLSDRLDALIAAVEPERCAGCKRLTVCDECMSVYWGQAWCHDRMTTTPR